MQGFGIVWTERASDVLPKEVKQTAFIVVPSALAGMLGLTIVLVLICNLQVVADGAAAYEIMGGVTFIKVLERC